MRTFLAFVGLCVLLGSAGWIGTRFATPEKLPATVDDPFEGIRLEYHQEKDIRVTCSRQASSKSGPSRNCVQLQVDALREYERMDGLYPAESSGLQAIETCEARTRKKTVDATDYVLLLSCVTRELERIEAGQLGNVTFVD